LREAECVADEWTKRAEAAARALRERRANIGSQARARAKDMITEARRSKALALLRSRSLDF
jgi:hypothetical protein